MYMHARMEHIFLVAFVAFRLVFLRANIISREGCLLLAINSNVKMSARDCQLPTALATVICAAGAR